MPWVITIPGEEPINELDFTLDEVDFIERESKTPWGIANPIRVLAVYRAYLKVCLKRVGRDPKEVDTYTQRDIRGWLDYVPDEESEEAKPEEVPTKARKGRKQAASSVTSLTSTTGPRTSAEQSA